MKYANVFGRTSVLIPLSKSEVARNIWVKSTLGNKLQQVTTKREPCAFFLGLFVDLQHKNSLKYKAWTQMEVSTAVLRAATMLYMQQKYVSRNREVVTNTKYHYIDAYTYICDLFSGYARFEYDLQFSTTSNKTCYKNCTLPTVSSATIVIQCRLYQNYIT